jgi:hypothetical protein
VALDAPDAAAFSKQLWDSLDAENKVSLFVRYVEIATGKASDVILNKY